jgi:hypothetical protein
MFAGSLFRHRMPLVATQKNNAVSGRIDRSLRRREYRPAARPAETSRKGAGLKTLPHRLVKQSGPNNVPTSLLRKRAGCGLRGIRRAPNGKRKLIL